MRTAALLTGTAGVLLIGIAVLSLTPRSGNEPLATSSTPASGAAPVTLTAPVAVASTTSWMRGPMPLATPVGTAGLAVVTSRALERLLGGSPPGSKEPMTVVVTLGDGRAARASVVDAGTEGGLAIVAINGPIATEGMSLAELLPDADELVTVLSDDPIVVQFGQLAQLDVADGTAVTNVDGELLGLCSDEARERFIPIDELLVGATTPPD